MKKYFFISLLLYSQFVLGQITASQFVGVYPGIMKHSNTGGITYYNDTAQVIATGVDTIMYVGFIAFSDYYLHQDSTFSDDMSPLIDYGHFYSTDSIYTFRRTCPPIQCYDEFHGKRLTSNVSFTNSELNQITIYPNPTSDKIYVSGLTAHEKFKINIYNSMGVTVLNSEKNNLDVSELPQGMYFLKIENKQGIVMKKVIIQH